MKLVGLAKLWWSSVESDIRRIGQPPISTWQEMKVKFREKYMPANYRDKLCEQLFNLKQGSMSIAKYMQKFDELKTRGQVDEEPCQTLARFKTGLKADIRREMLRQPVYNVEHAFQVALDMEEYLKYPITRKIGSQTRETTFKKFSESSSGAKPFNWLNGSKPSTNLVESQGKGVMSNNSSGKEFKCFKCREVGHMGYQCPKRSLHIGVEDEKERIQQDEDHKEDVFDYGVFTVDDLEENEVDTSLLSIMRCILATPKVAKVDWRQTSIFQI